MSENSKTVYLSPLKLAGIIPGPRGLSDTNLTATTPDLNSMQTAAKQPSLGSSHSKPHERLAADKIGEELAPDAGIWQVYLDEAKEQDDEMVDGKNKNLDMMLLFATLFSTILATFLIESKNLLQQDPNEVSIGLLLLIAQSQQRLEQGQPQRTLAPVQRPAFSAPISARWINGLWFLSLVLSLSAALVAMLAKEWLAAYNTSRPRSAHKYALLRQTKFDALFQWRALHIIDLLPSMLHLAFLLFALGLVLYLSMLDLGIAAVIGVVTGGTVLFYVATAFLGAIYEFCPFVTQISKYLERILAFCSKDWMIGKGYLSKQNKSLGNNTTDEDLNALTWLAEHARDPAAGDCSYQALAGLRLTGLKRSACAVSDSPSVPLEANAAPVDGITTEGHANTLETAESSGAPFCEYELVRGLFEPLCASLRQVLIQKPRELAACQGTNVARYANALPKLVDFLETYSGHQSVNKSKHSTKAPLISGVSARTAFDALDTIWSDECPPLSPSSYALLTSAELRLTVTAATPHLQLALTWHPISDAASARHPLPIIIFSNKDNTPTRNHAEITIESTERPLAESAVALFDLRARYSRALSRAGYLLRYHADGIAPIAASALMHMLDSIYKAAQCKILNPESQLSTHQPQSEKWPPPIIGARIIGMGYALYVGPNGIGDEDGLLVQLLRLAGSAEAQTNTGLEASLCCTFNAIVPVLLKQWLNLTLPNEVHGESEKSHFSKAQLARWPLVVDSNSLSNQATRLLTQQVVTIATVSLAYIGHPGIDQLPEIAIVTLHKRLRTDPSPFRAFETFAMHHDQVCQLVPLVDQHLTKLNQTTLEPFINIFLATYRNKPLFENPGIPPEHIAPFLRILAKVPGQAVELQTLLGVLVGLVEEYRRPQEQFTLSAEGFEALLRIGKNTEYRLIVAQSVTDIIRSTATWGCDHPISAQALPGLFDSITFALKTLSSNKESITDLLSSARKLTSLFGSFPNHESHIMATDPAIATLCHVLKTEMEKSRGQDCLLAELEEVQCWTDMDELPLRGLALLFGGTTRHLDA